MRKREPLTERQLRTLKVCWRLKKATGREIYDELLSDEVLDYRTIATRLNTLVAHGYLHCKKKDGKSRLFWPAVRKKTVLRQEIRQFLTDIVGEDELAWELLAEELANTRD